MTGAPTVDDGGDDREVLERLAGRVDAAMAAVSGMDASHRATAKELKAGLEAFHADALRRVVRALKDDERGRELLFGLVEDPVVHAALSLHGILRAPPQVRAEQALDGIRPYLESHGGDVELVELTSDGVARVRMLGACNGCSMTSQTLTNAVQVALVEQLPDLEGIEVVEDDPGTASALIAPSSLFQRPTDGPAAVTATDAGPTPPADALAPSGADDPSAPQHRTSWVRGPGLLEVADPGSAVVDVEGTSVLVVRDGGVVRAYRNACGHLGLELDDAVVGRGRVVCGHHGHQFDLGTGAGLTDPGSGLTPVPCRVEGVHVWLLPTASQVDVTNAVTAAAAGAAHA